MNGLTSADRGRSFVNVLLYCLLAYMASRATLTLIGVAAQTLVLPRLPVDSYAWQENVAPWLDIWGAWDTGWYHGIVQNGYMTDRYFDGDVAGQANWAFFPFYPMLSRLLTVIGIDSFIALLIVANLAFLALLPVAWHETFHLYGRRAADMCVLLLCVVPGTHFFSSGYSESTFLLAALCAFSFARRRRWILAGAAAAAAALTRNVGIVLGLPILIYFLITPQVGEAVEGWGRGLKQKLASREFLYLVVGLSLPVLALAGFMAFLRVRTGDALAFIHIQSAWGRAAHFPLTVLLFPRDLPEMLPNYVAAYISVALVGVLVWRRNWPHAAFAFVCVVLFLSAGILSFMRLALTVVPFALVAGHLLAAHPRTAALVLCCGAMLSGVLMAGWSIGTSVY